MDKKALTVEFIAQIQVAAQPFDLAIVVEVRKLALRDDGRLVGSYSPLGGQNFKMPD